MFTVISKRVSLLFLISTVLFFCGFSSIFGIQYTWTGTSSNDWQTGANWDVSLLNSYPGFFFINTDADEATINSTPGAVVNVSSGTITLHKLNIASGNAITIESPTSLIINTAGFATVGGNITGAGTFIVKGSVTLSSDITISNLQIDSGGSIDLKGFTLTVSNSASIAGSIQDSSGAVVGSLVVNGVLTIPSAASAAQMSAVQVYATSLVAESGSVLTMQNTARLTIDNTASLAGTIQSAGIQSNTIVCDAPVSLSDNTKIDMSAGNGSIIFNSTIDGSHDLELSTGTGSIDMNATVGSNTPLKSLILTSFGTITSPLPAVTLSGDWTNNTSETLKVSSIKFVGTTSSVSNIRGKNIIDTFICRTAGKQIILPTGVPTSVGAFEMLGSVANEILLSGIDWELDFTGTTGSSTSPNLKYVVVTGGALISGNSVHVIGINRALNNATPVAPAMPSVPYWIFENGNEYIWTGATDTVWTNTSNWTGGAVPSSSDDALIPFGVTNMPVISADASIGGLRIEAGATVTISNLMMLTTGSAILEGDINGGGTVVFNGVTSIDDNVSISARFNLTSTGKIDIASGKKLIVSNGDIYGLIGGGGILECGENIFIKEDVTFPKSIVTAGATLDVASGKTLSFAEPSSLAGSITGSGRVQIHTVITLTDNLDIFAELLIDSSGTIDILNNALSVAVITLFGTIEGSSGSSFKSTGSLTVTGGGATLLNITTIEFTAGLGINSSALTIDGNSAVSVFNFMMSESTLYLGLNTTLTTSGTVRLSGTIQGGALIFSSAVTVTDNTIIDTSAHNGNITFADILNSNVNSYNLELGAGTGSINMNATVGSTSVPFQSIVVTSFGTLSASSITLSGNWENESGKMATISKINFVGTTVSNIEGLNTFTQFICEEAEKEIRFPVTGTTINVFNVISADETKPIKLSGSSGNWNITYTGTASIPNMTNVALSGAVLDNSGSKVIITVQSSVSVTAANKTGANTPLNGKPSWRFISNDVLLWTGDISTDWHTGGNWSSSTLPFTDSNVLIPIGAPQFPVISNSVTVARMYLDSGATLGIDASIALTVTDALIAGNITGSGTILVTNEMRIIDAVTVNVLTGVKALIIDVGNTPVVFANEVTATSLDLNSASHLEFNKVVNITTFTDNTASSSIGKNPAFTFAGNTTHITNGFIQRGTGIVSFTDNEFETTNAMAHFNGSVLISGTANIITGTGAITFNSSVKGTSTLTLNTSGSVKFHSTVGEAGNALGELSLISASSLVFNKNTYITTFTDTSTTNPTFTFAGLTTHITNGFIQSGTGAVAVINSTFAGGAIAFNGAVDSTGLTQFNTSDRNASITFNNTLKGTDIITFICGTGVIECNEVVDVASIGVISATSVIFNKNLSATTFRDSTSTSGNTPSFTFAGMATHITNGFIQAGTGAVSLGGTFKTTNSVAQFNGVVSLHNSLVIDTDTGAGTIVFNNKIQTNDKNLELISGTGTIEFFDSIQGTAHGASLLTLNGKTRIQQNIVIDPNVAILLELSLGTNALTIHGTVTILAAIDITGTAGSVFDAKTVTVNASQSATFSAVSTVKIVTLNTNGMTVFDNITNPVEVENLSVTGSAMGGVVDLNGNTLIVSGTATLSGTTTYHAQILGTVGGGGVFKATTVHVDTSQFVSLSDLDTVSITTATVLGSLNVTTITNPVEVTDLFVTGSADGGVVNLNGNTLIVSDTTTLSGTATNTSKIQSVSTDAIFKSEKIDMSSMENGFISVAHIICGEITGNADSILKMDADDIQLTKDIADIVLTISRGDVFILSTLSIAPMLTVPANLFIAAGSAQNVIFSKTLTVLGSLVLFSGTVQFPSATTIEKDMVLLQGDATTMFGTNNIYTYNGDDAGGNPIRNTVVPSVSVFPSILALGAVINHTQYYGVVRDLGGKAITVKKNFYANGVDLKSATPTWTLTLTDNNNSQTAFAEAYYLKAANSNVECLTTDGFAWVSAESATDGGGNMTDRTKKTGWAFTTSSTPQTGLMSSNPTNATGIPLSGTYTVFDTVIRLEFNYPIENSKNEISHSLALGYLAYNDGADFFSGSYIDPTCTVSTDGQGDVSVFYLQVADGWNTDATGSSTGDVESTNRNGISQSKKPSITISANNILKDMYKNHVSLVSNHNTADRVRPVLIEVRTGQEKHDTNFVDQKPYDAHNFIELRYSEPVYVAGFTSQKEYNAQSINEITGGLHVDGLIDIENGTLKTGARLGGSIRDTNKVHALYRYFSTDVNSATAQTYRIRISIAGYVDGVVADSTNVAGHTYDGYIDSATIPSGVVTVLAHTGITDASTALTAGNTLEPASSIAPGYGTTEYDGKCVVSMNNTVQSGTYYGGWDVSPPNLARPVWDAASTHYEALADTNGAGYVPELQFHFFDNTPSYDVSDTYKWKSSTGWYSGIQPGGFGYPDTVGGSRPNYENQTGLYTSGGIRSSTYGTATGSFPFSVAIFGSSRTVTLSNSIKRFVTINGFFGSGSETLSQSGDTLYMSLPVTTGMLRPRDTYVITYDDTKGFITDLAGNRLKNSVWQTIDRIPPKITLTVTPLNDTQMLVYFNKPLKLSRGSDNATIDDIHSEFKFHKADGTDVGDLSAASARLYYKGDATLIILTLSRSVSLDELMSIYISLKEHSLSDPITRDLMNVSKISDEAGNWGDSNIKIPLSYFGVNIISPLYASDGIIQDGLNSPTEGALRIFDGTQRLFTERTITLATKINFSNTMNPVLPEVRLFIDTNPNPNSRSLSFNINTEKNIGLWLPTETIPYNVLSPEANTKAFAISEHKLDTTLRNFTIPFDKPLRSSGDQMEFLFQFGTIKTPDPNTGLLTINSPFYCIRLSDPNDITSLDVYRFSVTDLLTQRGGVSILNNVINAHMHEKTIIEVITPKDGSVTIQVLTLDGNIVRTLQKGRLREGKHYFEWDGSNTTGSAVARGMYFIRVVGPDINETRKVMVVKE